jgi:hypothetical protein
MSQATFPRRTTETIPADVRAWFAGELVDCWSAVLEPARGLLPHWWALWLREHPGATPPATDRWIATPLTAEQLRKAQSAVADAERAIAVYDRRMHPGPVRR